MALMVLLAPCCFATSYYLSAAGNDSAAGTAPTTAWKTLARLNSAALNSGDIIYLRGGDTFPGTLKLPTNNLTATSYGAGTAAINAGTGDGVDIFDVSGAQLNSLIIEGGWNAETQSGNSGIGVNAYCDLPNAQKLIGLTLTNLTVHGFQQEGICLGAHPTDGSKSGFSTVLIQSCTAYSNGNAGIESYGYFNRNATTYAHSGVVVTGCTVYDNEGLANATNNTGNGIELGDVQNAAIAHCVAYNNGQRNVFSGGGPVGIWAWDSDSVTIEWCESHDNHSQTADGDGFDLDGGVTNSAIQYCYAHNNDGAGFLVAEFSGARTLNDLTLRYNISQNDGQKGGYGSMVLWNGGSGVQNCEIYNNTFYSSDSSPAVNFFSAVSNVYLRDNVIASTVAPLVNAQGGLTGILFQSNDYWAGGGPFIISNESSQISSLAAWQALGQEKIGSALAGLWTNPGYVALGGGQTLDSGYKPGWLLSYYLTQTSALIGSGVAMSTFGVAPGNADFFGYPIQATTIGASSAKLFTAPR